MNPADRILAVCAEMRAAEEYSMLVGPFQYGAWRQALEDVAACLSSPQITHDMAETPQRRGSTTPVSGTTAVFRKTR